MKDNQWHMLVSTIRKKVHRDQHASGLGGYLGRNKTLTTVEERFY